MEKYYCDCGNELDFIAYGAILDEYGDKILRIGLYHCTECSEDYEINVEEYKD